MPFHRIVKRNMESFYPTPNGLDEGAKEERGGQKFGEETTPWSSTMALHWLQRRQGL